MALAQETDLLLLDEPTTFLDVTHQVDLLDLLKDLNRRNGTTVVLVLHDLNLAFRYADHLVVLKAGASWPRGPPPTSWTGDVGGRVRAGLHGGARPGERGADGRAARPPPRGADDAGANRLMRAGPGARRVRTTSARLDTPGRDDVGDRPADRPRPGELGSLGDCRCRPSRR